MFFLGSIPFTTAAYLQLYQAANAAAVENHAGPGKPATIWFGWKPGDAGWLSCALQFAGTVLFNVNTFDGIHPASIWWQQDLAIWVPNLLGCIAFMISALLAFFPPHALSIDLVTPSLACTLIGAIAFLIGGLLLLPETSAAQ